MEMSTQGRESRMTMTIIFLPWNLECDHFPCSRMLVIMVRSDCRFGNDRNVASKSVRSIEVWKYETCLQIGSKSTRQTHTNTAETWGDNMLLPLAL